MNMIATEHSMLKRIKQKLRCFINWLVATATRKVKVISEGDAFKHTQAFDLEKPKWRCRLNHLLCIFVAFAQIFGFLYKYDDLECRMCCLKKGCSYYKEAVMFLKQNPTCWNKHILGLLLGGIED